MADISDIDSDSAGRVRIDGHKPDAPVAGHIVVGYDTSTGGQHALAVAADFARRLDARLHVVHAIDLRDFPTDPDTPDWEDAGDLAVARAAQEVRDRLADQAVGWTYHAWRGSPVRLLILVAEETDALMMVVGTHGPGLVTMLQRLRAGSVSRGLVDHALRPVLVVPPPVS